MTTADAPANQAGAPTPTVYTVTDALEYVRDTYSLRNPVERALADGLMGTLAARTGERARALTIAREWAGVGLEARFALQLGAGAAIVEALDALARAAGLVPLVDLEAAPTAPAAEQVEREV